MKKAVLIWFLAANAFCFVTAAVDLTRPWGLDFPASVDAAHAEDVVLLTQASLGGALGSYAALKWTDRNADSVFAHRDIALYALMVQNFLGYGIALVLAALVDRRRSAGRSNRDSSRADRFATGEQAPRRDESMFRRNMGDDEQNPRIPEEDDNDVREDQAPARFG